MKRIGLPLVVVLALAPAAPVWAQFWNSELTAQVKALQQSSEALHVRLGKLESAMQQNQQMLDLLREVETLKADVAKLRGLAEVQEHQMEALGKRQTDLYVDLDQRIADLSKAAAPAAAADGAAQATTAPPASGPAAGATASPAAQVDTAAETSAYESAFALFRENNFAGAIAAFRGFLKTYPDGTLASNAQYWMGYSYYALKDYKTALAHQQKLILAYPKSAKVPDAMLNIANNQIALENLPAARKMLDELVARYPGTNAAELAARRLSTLK